MMAILLAAALAGCGGTEGDGGSGVSGGSGASGDSAQAAVETPAVPLFDLTGNWSAVVPDPDATTNMFLFEFAADGTCAMQLAKYASDFWSCKYYGNYSWSADGKQLVLDLYHGEYETIVDETGATIEEYHDQGRDNAVLFATVTFKAVTGDVRSFILIAEENADAAEPDGIGETERVVDKGAFLVVQPESSPQRFFGEPYLASGGGSVIPDTFLPAPEPCIVANTTDGLNVRTGPGIDYDSLTPTNLLPNGAHVDRVATLEGGSPDWVFCIFDWGGGWLSTDYLETTSGYTPAAVTPQTSGAAETDTAADTAETADETAAAETAD
jgi:hypothetical protein